MCVREWVPQVPSHAPHDNVTGIVASLERIRGSDGQPLPYQPALLNFAMEPYFRPRRKQNEAISLSPARRQFLFKALELESLFFEAQSGTTALLRPLALGGFAASV